LSNGRFFENVKRIAIELTDEKIPYQFIDTTSLRIQGVSGFENKHDIILLIQWDLLEKAYHLYESYYPKEITKDKQKASFQFTRDDYLITVLCYFNTTIKTDPYRISIVYENIDLWCHSLYAEIYIKDYQYSNEIHAYLLSKHEEMTAVNQEAWNQNNYQALINRFGTPGEAALKLIENPRWRLHPFQKYLPEEMDAKKVLHLLGSNGVKGVSLALLGADVTIVDFSNENRAFANELSNAAGVSIQYIVSDALSISEKVIESFDIVLMELGVLHYFIDLKPLATTIKQMLKSEGRFMLHEFHPISTKLITSNGKKHKVTGNYFDPSIHTQSIAFSKHLSEVDHSESQVVYQRRWTLGEVITTFSKEGLVAEVLEEEPNHKQHDIGLPKTFTLICKKI